MRVLAAHPQYLLGHLFPVYSLMTIHTHGPLILPSCGSDSACRLVINVPRKPARVLGQPVYLPTVDIFEVDIVDFTHVVLQIRYGITCPMGFDELPQ